MGGVEGVREMWASGLHEDVKIICNLMLTLNQHNQRSPLTPTDNYQLLIYYADALFNTSETSKAEVYYRSALGLAKVIKGDKGKQQELTSEADLRFKLSQVYKALRQPKDGLSVLEAIPVRSRSVAVHKALGKLYQQLGMNKSAVASYKEVVKVCPRALDAIQGLLKLGLKSPEVFSLCLMGDPSLASETAEWFFLWTEGQGQMAERNYSMAAKTFSTMEAKVLPGNAEISNLLGEAHFMGAQPVEARLAWKRAFHADPAMVKNSELLAFLLIEERSSLEVEQLSTALMHTAPHSVQAWMVCAMYAVHMKKYERGLTLCQKVLQMDPTNYMGHLVTGLAQLLMNKPWDATVKFREALRLDEYRWEGYKFLIDAYLHLNRVREAVAMANAACKAIGTNTRTYYLYGKCLSKDPNNIEKAKQYLEKSLELNPLNSISVHCLGELLLLQKKYTRGIELLKAAAKECYSSKLYKLLGDFHSAKGDRLDAINYYNMAFNLDPHNQVAKEAAAAVAKSADGSISYERDQDMMGGALNDSDMESGEEQWT